MTNPPPTRTEPVWGVNEQRNLEHAYVEKPNFPWRTYKPRSMCGNAWSPTVAPRRDETLNRCQRCEQFASQLDQAAAP